MMPRLSAHMTVMQAAAQKAAKRLLRDFNEVENLQVSMKGPGDFVSQADLRAEQSIREDLEKARPGYGMLMEESGESGSDKWTWRWIVDPLDGTTNFLHGIPHWAISIALERRLPDNLGTEIAAAVVYSPVNNELFWAEKGVGAYVNDKRLRVSARREMRDAVFATGIPFAITTPNHRLGFARTLSTLMPQVAGIRRFGSAALDLAWVAAGRYDGYWEMGVHAWDIAAGMLIVREAGGYATDGEGKDVVARTVVAGNPHMHPKLLEVVQDGLAASKG
jgi:myo-inositol-1(or 4)-monophosphatase